MALSDSTVSGSGTVVQPPSGIAKRLDASERGFTWRSILIGTICVIAVCTLVPYNDFVLSDTSLAAGYLPLAAVLIEFLLIVVVNAPLHRWRPQSALNPRELAVIVMMLLIGCSLPNWGLMRFFIPTPVAPFYLGATNPQFWRAFSELNLPEWLFPVGPPATGRSSNVMWWFYFGTPQGERAPYGAWLLPLAAWGIFLVAMIAALAALARMMLEQWIGNERLPFPLVQVQAALIEAPAPGRALNAMLRSRLLWVGLGAVFVVHGINAMHVHQSQYFPQIPLGYDLSGVFANEPFVYLRTKIKAAMLSFMVIGVTYFIRTRVAFSLFGIYLLVSLMDVQAAMAHTELGSAVWADQHIGACIAFVLGILWIGRAMWWRILKNAVGAGTDGAYRLSFWIFIVGVGVMLAWLMVVGVQLWVALVIVLIILITHVVVARVVAETGIPFYRTGLAVSQVYTAFPATAVTGRDVFFSGIFSILGPLTTRDGILGLTQHGMGVVRTAGVRAPRKLGMTVAWALLVGFVVAAGVTLYCQYNYSTPLTRDQVPQRNWFGAVYIPERDMGNALISHAGGQFMPVRHNRALHVSIGFAATVLLEVASLRWASWPLLPVGFVTSYGAFIQNVWFSIFVGWLVKVVLLKYGGATMYQRARPVFVGMIFGEALAAGFWLIVNALLLVNGFDNPAVNILL